MANRLRELRGLAEILTKQPGKFPSAIFGLFKNFARNIWDLRGGGLYACGFIITLAWLEITMLIEDVISFSGFGNIHVGQIFKFIIGLLLESVLLTLKALIWPIYVLEISPLWGGIVLLALYFVFPGLIKPPLESWLFDGERD